MKNKIDRTMIITTIVCLLPIVLSAAFYDRLPAQIATHWNAAGEPDDYSSKAFAAFGLPLMMAALNLFVHFMINNDPKQRNIAKTLKLMAKWMLPIMTVVLMPITLLIAVGHDIRVEQVVPVFVSILFIFIGNYLPKCRQNYTAGIRLPWTLNSEANWNKTHHLAGFVWVIGGIAMALVSIFQIKTFPIFMGIVAGLVLIPSAYSYVLYRRGI